MGQRNRALFTCRESVDRSIEQRHHPHRRADNFSTPSLIIEICVNSRWSGARSKSHHVAFRRYGQNTQVAFAGLWGSQLCAWLD